MEFDQKTYNKIRKFCRRKLRKDLHSQYLDDIVQDIALGIFCLKQDLGFLKYKFFDALRRHKLSDERISRTTNYDMYNNQEDSFKIDKILSDKFNEDQENRKIDLKNVLEKVSRDMPKKYRDILYLYHTENYTQKEIARAKNVSSWPISRILSIYHQKMHDYTVATKEDVTYSNRENIVLDLKRPLYKMKYTKLERAETYRIICNA